MKISIRTLANAGIAIFMAIAAVHADFVTNTITAGTDPYAVAVNPVTNRIYVANKGSDNVTVIDGATNGTTTVPACFDLATIAVNPATNKVYVAGSGNGKVIVIDGATNGVDTVLAGTGPF